MTTTSKTPKGDAFHAHLEQCPQCLNRPWDLCRTGARLFEAAGDEADMLFDPKDLTQQSTQSTGAKG